MIESRRSDPLTRLASIERRGMYWDCDVSAARSDLELLRKHTRPGESLDENIDHFEALFNDEKDRHRAVDPTGPARRAIEVIDRCQEPGEDKARCVEAYRKLWSHTLEKRYDEGLDESVEHRTRRRYELIDSLMLEGDDRVQCVAQFLQDQRGFPALKQKEREQRAQDEAELARQFQSVKKPDNSAGIAQQEEYLIVGGARVPNKFRLPLSSLSYDGCAEPD